VSVPRLIVALWLALTVFWLLSATRAKRTLDLSAQRKGIAIRLAIVVLVVLAFRVPAVRLALRDSESYQLHSTVFGLVGTLLVVVGIGLAVSARIQLGRNWGMPASRKENPELITGGPYQFVRHPIYAGFLIALLGTAIALSVLWLLPLVLFGAYFIYAARQEERYMAETFPEQYPAYKRRTKMLVPFVV
jgi:protein-S-isoprenylcysteine O-methyltransferase Ste14